MKAKEAQSKIKPSLAGAACRELSFGTKIARIGCVVRTKACDNEKTESFLHYRFIICNIVYRSQKVRLHKVSLVL